MKAWNKDDAPSEHPEPWGLRGVFSTLKVLDNRVIPFCESYLNRLIESAKKQAMPWIPDITLLEQKARPIFIRNESGSRINQNLFI